MTLIVNTVNERNRRCKGQFDNTRSQVASIQLKLVNVRDTRGQRQSIHWFVFVFIFLFAIVVWGHGQVCKGPSLYLYLCIYLYIYLQLCYKGMGKFARPGTFSSWQGLTSHHLPCHTLSSTFCTSAHLQSYLNSSSAFQLQKFCTHPTTCHVIPLPCLASTFCTSGHCKSYRKWNKIFLVSSSGFQLQKFCTGPHIPPPAMSYPCLALHPHYAHLPIARVCTSLCYLKWNTSILHLQCFAISNWPCHCIPLLCLASTFCKSAHCKNLHITV